MTITVALRASSIVVRRSAAARGAREEDDPLGVARDLVEGLDHASLAAPSGGLRWHSGPHPLVELLAERRDETFLVLADLGVPLGEQDLAVSGRHPQQL